MTEATLDFKPSRGFSVGVELELQILNPRDYNLARDAKDLLVLLEKTPHPGEVKPEITESMIELNSSVHYRHETLLDELVRIRDTLADAAGRLNLRIAGGGSHPFHDWTDRRIYPTERFKHILEVYGYLAKQFTIFGQHVHIGCPDGDAALYLVHALARYVPHFIALSASSPFQQGEDTSYHSSRLNTVSAFPLSGHAPLLQDWAQFNSYFEKMRRFGVISSVKDFYWDIRPKPEYGTVEIRVFDTPLTVERAAMLAAYAQSLARYLLLEKPLPLRDDIYLLHSHNRFQACRYGLEGTLIDALNERRVPLQQDVLETLSRIAPHAAEVGAAEALRRLAEEVEARREDANWLREQYRSHGSLHDVARVQSEVWMGLALESA
jgi:glutamate---cysteine ligase / carboxylate-amine ligase